MKLVLKCAFLPGGMCFNKFAALLLSGFLSTVCAALTSLSLYSVRGCCMKHL